MKRPNHLQRGVVCCLGLIAILLIVSTAPADAWEQSFERLLFSEVSPGLPQVEPDLVNCPGGIAYGETIQCSIVGNETDSYSFVGSANDRIIARVQITSGSVDPMLAIDGPGASCSDSTIFNVLELSCQLSGSGPGTIRVSGSAGQNGGYNLHLQRSNDPANQTPIAYGETLSGNIAAAPEMDVFAFSGSAGDQVIVRKQITSGTFDPHLRIYNPDGSQLCADDTIFNQLELNCTLVSDGLHMIFVFGGDGQTGWYNLFLQRSNDPADQTPIAYGQTLSGNISITPEMDVFAFSGSAGEQVIVRKQITSGTFDPHLRIYNTDGSQLCADDTIFNQLELNCTLVSDGLHMIFVSGGDGQTGWYNLFLQRSNDPADQTPIAYGQTLSGNISIAPEMEVFAFTGSAGDRVIVRKQITSGTFDPHLRVYNPDGSKLCSDDTIFNQLEINCTLVTDGLHMIFASGGDGQTGGYNLYLQRSNEPTDQTPIAYGQTLSGNISIAPEMEVFAFTGSAGDRVIVRKQITSGTFDPHLRVYNPDGSQLCTDDTIFNQLEINCTLVTDGLHMIFAYGGDGQTGGYNLYLQRSNEPTDPIPISYGQTLVGHISVAPKMDVFKIDTSANVGDTLVASLKITAANLDPHLRIYHIDGTLLCQDSTIFDELELICQVNKTGVHTVFVYGGDNQTGSYELCVHDGETTCDYQVMLPFVRR